MKGHIRKRVRSDGSIAWQVRMRHGGKEVLKTFERKRDAEDWLRDRQAAKLRGDLISPEVVGLTFAQLVEDWRASWGGRLQPKTVERYEQVLRAHLLPEFGTTLAHSITTADLQRYIVGMRLAPGTVRKVHTVLSAAYGEGMRLGTVRTNPARGIRLPRVERLEMTILTASEVEALAAMIESLPSPGGRQAALAVRLAAYTGLRAGEQWGLCVGDVDLIGRRLRVTRALKDVGGRLEFGPTKSHQARTVVFPRALAKDLSRQIDARSARPDVLLFTGAYGSPIRHNLFRARAFRPAVLAALPTKSKLRWHDLRHTYASLAAIAGAQPKDVQAQLGHASITMTLDRYTHLFPEQGDALAARIDALISSGRDDDEPPALVEAAA